MKNLIIWVGLLCPILLSAQNYCDSLFYQLNPAFVSLNTQKLVLNEVLQCHIDQGQPDTFSMYDHYFNGMISDNASEVEQIIHGILDDYIEDYPSEELYYNIDALSKITRRSTKYNLNTQLPSSSAAGSTNSFMDDQMSRLVGNLTDSYFVNGIETLPFSVSDLIDDYAARKIAYMQVRDGINIFDEMNAHTDSLEFLFSKLDIALIDPILSLSPLFNRHLNYYVYIMKDSINAIADTHIAASTQAISTLDTAFVHDIDRAGIIASQAYTNYRNGEVLSLASSMNIISINTALNLDNIQCIQDILTTKMGELDAAEQNLNGSTNPLGDAEIQYAILQEVLQSSTLIKAYLSGNLNLLDIAATFGNATCSNGSTVTELVEEINERPDMSSIAKILNHTAGTVGTVGSIVDEIIGVDGSFGIAGGAISGATQIALDAVIETAAFLWIAGGGDLDQLGADFAEGVEIYREIEDSEAFGVISSVGSQVGNYLLDKVIPSGIIALFTGGLVDYLITTGLEDVFGISEPDPVMDEINALREEMNGRFDDIEDQLDDMIDLIKESTETIMDGIQVNRDLMQYNFNNVNYQLAEILENQSQIQSDLQNLLLTSTGFNHCATNIEVINDINPLTRYSDLELAFTNSFTLPSCLNGLTDALVNNVDCGNIAFFKAYNSGSAYAMQEVENYKKITALFKYIYETKMNIKYNATQLLMMEPDHTIDNQWDVSWLYDSDIDFSIDPDLVLDPNNYIDANSLATIMEYYKTFLPFLEVFTSSTNLDPLEIEAYLNLLPIAKAFRIAFLTLYSENLQCIGRMAKAQQALMSGSMMIDPMYSIIYGDQMNDESLTYNGQNFNVKRFCIDILKNNSILSSNFASLTINNNYGNKSKVQFVNLIENGDFSKGNTGFTSDMTHTIPKTRNGQYAIFNNPNDWDSPFIAMADHSLDDDFMLMCDPDGNGSTIVWSQDIALEKGNYDFSLWATSIFNSSSNLPEIKIRINGNDIFLKQVTSLGSWEEHKVSFYIDTAKTLTIDIIDPVTTGNQNDLGIDDIRLVNSGNLVFNGNFSAGDTSFYSSLNQVSSKTNADPEGLYGISSDPNLWWTTLSSMSEITGNTNGKMLVADPESGAQDTLWMQTVQLEKGVVYEIGYSIAETFATDHEGIFELRIIDTSDVPVILSTHTISSNNYWESINEIFIPDTTGGHELQIVNTTIASGVNNPAIDNIYIERQDFDYNLSYIVSDNFWKTDPFNPMVNTELEIESQSQFKAIDIHLIQDDDMNESYHYLSISTDIAECTTNTNIACDALILVPSIENLKEDVFIFTESFAKLLYILQDITDLHVNTTLPKYYPTDDWLEATMTKSILVNKSNQ